MSIQPTGMPSTLPLAWRNATSHIQSSRYTHALLLMQRRAMLKSLAP
ncbi:hypothetical protein M0D45_03200 [Xanthomonas prunicola]|nr:hypothetical protein [Xanthomonas prunicola]UXA55423.1 hypothetical protein M0D45_03200 [Xanthomonas prunicola]